VADITNSGKLFHTLTILGAKKVQEALGSRLCYLVRCHSTSKSKITEFSNCTAHFVLDEVAA